ncbi:MAG: hypothetical protein Q9216_002332 [Gyalolechia sp. 2 TL-2023]
MTSLADFDFARLEASVTSLNGLFGVLHRFFNDVEEPESQLLYELTTQKFRERFEELEGLIIQFGSLRSNLEAAYEQEHADLRTSQQTLQHDQSELAASQARPEGAVGEEKALLLKSQEALEESQHELSSRRGALTVKEEALEQRSSSLAADQQKLEESQAVLRKEQLELAGKQFALDTETRLLSRDRNAWQAERDSVTRAKGRLEERQETLKRGQDELYRDRVAVADRDTIVTGKESQLVTDKSELDVEVSINGQDIAFAYEELDDRVQALDTREQTLDDRDRYLASKERDLSRLDDRENHCRQLEAELISRESEVNAQIHARENELNRRERTVNAQLEARQDELKRSEAGIEKIDAERLTGVVNEALDNVDHLIRDRFDEAVFRTTALESILGRVEANVGEVREHLVTKWESLLEKLDELPSSIEAVVAARENGPDGLGPLSREIDAIKKAIIDLNHQLRDQPPARLQLGTSQSPLARHSKRSSEVSLADSGSAPKRRMPGRTASGQASPVSRETSPQEQSSTQSRPRPLQRRTTLTAQLPGAPFAPAAVSSASTAGEVPAVPTDMEMHPDVVSVWNQVRLAGEGWDVNSRHTLANYFESFRVKRDEKDHPPNALDHCAKSKGAVCLKSYAQHKPSGFGKDKSGEIACTNCGFSYFCIRVKYVEANPGGFDPESVSPRWFLELRRP